MPLWALHTALAAICLGLLGLIAFAIAIAPDAGAIAALLNTD